MKLNEVKSLAGYRTVREVNTTAADATIILARAGRYPEKQIYEFFDLLMGYSTGGARLDTWAYIQDRIKAERIFLPAN